MGRLVSLIQFSGILFVALVAFAFGALLVALSLTAVRPNCGLSLGLLLIALGPD